MSTTDFLGGWHWANPIYGSMNLHLIRIVDVQPNFRVPVPVAHARIDDMFTTQLGRTKGKRDPPFPTTSLRVAVFTASVENPWMIHDDTHDSPFYRGRRVGPPKTWVNRKPGHAHASRRILKLPHGNFQSLTNHFKVIFTGPAASLPC